MSSMFKVAEKGLKYNSFYVHKGALYGYRAGMHYVYFGERSETYIYVWIGDPSTYDPVDETIQWKKIKLTSNTPRFKWFDVYDVHTDYNELASKKLTKQAYSNAIGMLSQTNTREYVRTPSTKGFNYTRTRKNDVASVVLCATIRTNLSGADCIATEVSVSKKGTVRYRNGN